MVPVQISSAGAFAGSLTATTTLTAVTAGNDILVVAMHGDSAGTGPALTISDAQGTYTLDVVSSSGLGVARTVLAHLTNANAGTHTINCVASSGTGANSSGRIIALEVPPCILDQSNIAGGNSAAIAVSATAALAATSELAICGIFSQTLNNGGGTFPPTGGTGAYTSLVSHITGADANYQTLSSTAGAGANWGTLSFAGKYTALVAVYNAFVAPSPNALLGWPKQTFVTQTLIQF